MATYVNDLRLKEIATGDESGTWGTSTNTNLELIGEAFSFGTEAITTNADTHTTTIADGSTDPGRSLYLKYTGTLDSACTITIGPNTVSKLWFIENGTSGSQNIIISQGSGANVTIPAGHVKAVYSDGAGSGAAMVDAFTNLNLGGTTTVDDLTISDDLTVTDDMSIGGALTLTGNGDFNGDLDVDGTTNLDVVDIDGAVDMASTLAVGGNATVGGNLEVSGADVTITANIIHAGDTNTFFGFNDADTFRITTGGSEALRVDSSQNLFVGKTSSGLNTVGVEFASSGRSRFTRDGNNVAEFNRKSDHGSLVSFNVDATSIGTISSSSSDFVISSSVSDKDILFKGNDGGSSITALTLDMSDAGAAKFNHTIEANGYISVEGTSGNTGSASDRWIGGDGTAGTWFYNVPTGSSHLFGINNSNQLVITGTGVGIGTSSPSSYNAKADDLVVATSSDTGISIISGTSSEGALAFGDGTSGSSPIMGRVRYNHSSNEMDFRVNNEQVMTINSSGNIGIGETSPATDLHITNSSHTQLLLDSGTSSQGILLFGDADDSNVGSLTYDHSDNSMRFETSDSERMRINSSGRLLIGSTTEVATTGGTGAAQVLGTGNSDTIFTLGRFSNNTGAAAINFVKSRNGTIGGNTIVQDDDTLGSIVWGAADGSDFVSHAAKIDARVDGTPGANDTPGRLGFYTTADGSDSAVERMRIDSSGKVGIGTTSPATDLHIASATPTLTFTDTDNNYDATIAGLSGSLVLKADANDEFGTESIQFHTGGSQRAQFDSSGGLLIGTTTRISDTNNGGASFTPVSSGRQRLELGHTSSSTLAVAQFFGNSSETAAGNIACSGGACDFNTSSDARRKNVLGEAKGLEVINKLNPVHFEWKESKEKQDGLIAQEVEPVVSNAVSISDDGYYVMDYSKLVTPLIKAVQEQQEQIESLRSEIAILKGE